MEIGIPYILTGPDGTRAVFNDPTDVDFVGYLDAESGITGLMDTADVRESFTNHTEADGGAQGNNFLSRRVGTMQGIVWPGGDQSIVNNYISKINRAARGRRSVAPSVLTWTPTGGSGRRMELWRQGKITYTGRRPKKFMIPLSSADSYTYSQSMNSAVITLAGSSGDLGFTDPMTNPITTNYLATITSGAIFNAGDTETWPKFTFSGPITNPGVLNNTTGLSWSLAVTLSLTDVLVVDSKKRSVTLNGYSMYSLYAANFLSNVWWSLQPGSNDVRLTSFAGSAGAGVTVQWRDCYE